MLDRIHGARWRKCGLMLAPVLLVIGAPGAIAQLQSLPEVDVTNVRQVFHNGEHNAFTDLIRWRERYWLTFRSCPDGHMVHPTSRIIVLSSTDAQSWEKEFEFSVPLRDTRDPHFLAYREKLFVYTGTWYSGETTLPRDEYDLNKHLGYGAWTDDGEDWNGPQQLEGTYGHYIWRAAAHDGVAYLCARRNKDFAEVVGERDIVESAMLESDDGLNWRYRSQFQDTHGDETAFVFEGDGSLTAISRRGGSKAEIVRARPPYDEMVRADLSEYIGGPLLTRWGNRWVVGGRRNTEEGPKTVLYWLAENRLEPFAQLPSGGDNSYPGFVELSPTRAIVSWYSSHEVDTEGQTITAIYMADLVVAE